ncbi:hypothetical protein FHX82_004215 [Amycolatopsis bartoniae]|uniref:Small secreted protein n=1 Tax=Amycolatopsis bartoniae TaxID=941986 RepID=A0A8H9IRI2_9PSEU|nr:hypothetical protein [Amycolatopsis bartoniae]MBB2937151.1 hypothetical protein [Amycolatopsis bartoniae]TVT06024.1 hypothetical protein FNH07_21790 [Amycolatopsis bartoniae]GHF52812.1 hypothetical protein GCM10017566_27740 [Amycolatopsis bartoniae]
MRIRLLTVALAGLALTACGTASAPTSTENGPAITWSDHVCEVVRAGGVRLAQLPAVDPSAPAKAKDSLVTYLGSLSAALTDLANGITREGVPPVRDGQATLDRAMATLTSNRTSVDRAKEKLAAAPVTDQATFDAAVQNASTAFANLGTAEGPTKDLKDNPELAQAFGKAPNCRNLDGA